MRSLRQIDREERKVIGYLYNQEEEYYKHLWTKYHTSEPVRGTGYYPLSPNILIKSLEYLKEENKIKANSNFLDIGCGLGLNMIHAARQELNVYGIEINNILFQGAKQLIQKSKKRGIVDKQGICEIVEGNYFPEEYQILRENKNSIALKFEEDHTQKQKRKWEIELNMTAPPQFLFTEKKDDAYQKLGITLKDMDIIYSYCWAINVPSIFEIFSTYAKKDAILLIESAGMPKNTSKLLKTLNLNYKEGDRPSDYGDTFGCPLDIVTKK